MPNLREKTWTTTTPATVGDAQFWEDHLISSEDAAKAAGAVQSINNTLPDENGNINIQPSQGGPTVVDSLNSTSTTDALSANMGHKLNTEKVSIQQGSENVGKHLVVGNDGNLGLQNDSNALWGYISGDIENQADLQAALAPKVSETLLNDTVGWVGKNDFDKEHNYTLSYATLVQTETGFEITGTVTGYTTILYKLTNLKKNTDYKFKCLASTENGSRHVRIRRQNGAVDLYDAIDKSVFEATFNTGNYDYIQVNFYAGSDSTPSNSKVTYSDIMIWEASITDDTYYPYHKSVDSCKLDTSVFEEQGAVNHLNNIAASTGIFNVNADKSVTVNTNGEGSTTILELTQNVTNIDTSKNYKLLGCPSGGSASTYKLDFGNANYIDYGDGVVVPGSVLYNQKVRIVIYASAPVNKTFYPMIVPVDYKGGYVPYAMTNRELTEQKLDKAVTVLSSSDDLNDIRENGLYYFSTAPTHSPENIGYVAMIHFTRTTNDRKQVIFAQNAIYTRSYGGNPAAWGSWYKFTGTVV